MTGPLILNRYRLLETKGKGGFGTVDVAWDSRLQRRVAIKRIPLAIDETDLPGIQEARTAALLNDARIVNVLDFEVTGTEALIIMENVDGPTLTALLKESTELLDLDTIAAIAGDVAAALEYAHENQVLHLDIKPDNILIDHAGHIKVTDFGLSELSGTAGFAEPQGGTIGYMPPEQLTQGDVDNRTDLWALAILCYQLLTGKNPFLASTTETSYGRILNDPLPLPSALCPELDPAIDEALVRALMADKEQRFLSVAEFYDEIAPWLGDARSGRKKLKYRVNERDLDDVEFSDDWHQENAADGGDEEGDEDDSVASAPLWDRLPNQLRGALGRFFAALACGSFAFLGLSGFGLTPSMDFAISSEPFVQSNAQFFILVGIILLIALGGFLVPQLGSALACVALAAGVVASGAPVVGAVLAAALVAWWLLAGRKGRVDSAIVMLTPLLGALWMGFALPLLAGLLLPWRRALGAAATQWLILITLVMLTGTGGDIHTAMVLLPQEGLIPVRLPALLLHPQTWVMLLAFVLSALVMALLAARGSTPITVLGAVVGAAILAVSCVAVPLFIESDLWLIDSIANGASVALSFILVFVLSLTGISADAVQGQP
jgi:serine/threonine protein kinase